MGTYRKQLDKIDEEGNGDNLQRIRTRNKRAVSKTISIAILIFISVVIPFFAMLNTSYSATPPSSEDYQLWVQPYLSQIEGVREVMMTPFQTGSFGYNAQYGLVEGGGIEPSPAIGVPGGYNNIIVISDNNLEGGLSLDYWNSASSPLASLQTFINFNTKNYGSGTVDTDINGQVRKYLSQTWFGVGACSAPFTPYTYPGSFHGTSSGYLLDRREPEYGFIDPYASILIQPGIHIGGIGNNCGTEGQTWFLSGYGGFTGGATSDACQGSQPCINTEFPSSSPVVTDGGDDTQGFLIMEYDMQCVAGTAPCSLWQNAFLTDMARYPWSDTRGSAHFIEAARATQAWTMSNMTYDGMSAKTMLQDTISNLWADGVDPSNGGMYQNWGTPNDGRTPEPNMQVLTAFNPNLPSWFTLPTTTTSASSTTSTTSHTTSSTTHTTSSTTHTTSSTTSTSQSTTSSTTSRSTTSSTTTSHSSQTTSTSISSTTSTDSTITNSGSSSTSSDTNSNERSGAITTVTTTISTTVTNPSFITSTASPSVSAQTITSVESGNLTVTITRTVTPKSTTIESSQSGISNSETSSLIANSASTSNGIGSSIALTTSKHQTAPPVAASSPTSASAPISLKQPKPTAMVLGGFAAFETFIIGVIPISLLGKMSRLGGQKSTREWQW